MTDATSDLTCAECLTILAEAGDTGPTSYLMPKLRQIVADVQAGAKPAKAKRVPRKSAAARCGP